MLPNPPFVARRLLVTLLSAGFAVVASSCHRADEPVGVPAAPTVPTFTSIAPNAGVVGTSVTVTLSGANFSEGGTTVTVHGTGLKVTGISVVNSSAITATLVIDGAATVGDDTLWVATPGGNSGGEVFTVRPHTPTLASVSTNIAFDSTTVGVTLIGTNFVIGATKVTVSNSGIAVDSVSVLTDATLTAKFVIATIPKALTAFVKVQTSGGLSDSVAFRVIVPPPSFTGMTPNSMLQGTSGSVFISGSNFVQGTSLAATGTGVHFNGVVATSDTTVGATYGIDKDATLGPHTVTVTTTSGSNPASQSRTLTVVAPVPTLATVSPITGSVGNTVAVTLTGGAFQPGATSVTVSDPAISVTNVNVTSWSSLTANFVIAPNATPGNDTVTATTVGGTSDPRVFAVAAHGSQLLTYTGGVQTFTVPAGYTSVTITAVGAGGGSPVGETVGGIGAGVTGTFSVAAGSTLSVIVGGGGGPASAAQEDQGGGGGGSFVFDPSSSLLIAAGGGGGGCLCSLNAPDAVFTSAGAAGSGTGGGAGGVAGNGGAADTVPGSGGGGGGTISGGAGVAGQYTSGGGGVSTASSGGSGGAPFANSGGTGTGVGGYGGGGAGASGGGGGGGGFSGGGAGGPDWASGGSGGGGGSFNGGTNQSTTTGGFAGGGSAARGMGANGWVIIVW
jgi:hypothetical protein